VVWWCVCAPPERFLDGSYYGIMTAASSISQKNDIASYARKIKSNIVAKDIFIITTKRVNKQVCMNTGYFRMRPRVSYHHVVCLAVCVMITA
jgi:hypothetical protein